MLKNLLVKDNLAKLLAGENIAVIHDNVSWPYFDVKERVLGLPIWDVDEYTHNMLTGHEVGHAVETPPDWYKVLSPQEGGSSDLKTAMNIVEDARIERLILRRYPGLRRDFREGYKAFREKLWKKTIETVGVNNLSIADRVNLHFKLEVSGELDLGIEFSPVEQRLVDRIAVAEDFAEVVELSRELLAMQKLDQRITMGDDIMGDGDTEIEIEIDEDCLTPEQLKEIKRQAKENKGKDKPKGGVTVKVRMKSEDGEEGESDDGEGSDSDNETESKGHDGEGDTDGEGDDGDETDGADGDGEGDADGEEDGEGEGDESETDHEAGGEGGQKGGHGGPDEPRTIKIRIRRGEDTGLGQTQREFQQETAKAASKNAAVQNCKIGKPAWEKLIVPYKKILGGSRKKVERLPSYVKWAQEQKPLVNFLINDFNRKKAARQLEAKRTDKTGKLNLKKLYAYKISEDLFKSAVALPGAKKHALIMFIDCSGSMSGTKIQGAIQQLLTLTAFADAIKIPYRVYGFTSKSSYMNPNELYPAATRDKVYGAVGPESELVLYEFFHERMTRQERNKMIDMLWNNYCAYNQTYGWPVAMNGTPMLDSMFYAVEGLGQLMRATSAQIGHVIYLTDGEDNQRCHTFFGNNPYGEVYVHDRGKVYEFGHSSIGSIEFFRKVLADRYGAELVNFFIVAGSSRIELNPKAQGWTEEYFVGDQVIAASVVKPLEANSAEGKRLDLNHFVKAQINVQEKNRKMRFVLSNFVNRIAKSMTKEFRR